MMLYKILFAAFICAIQCTEGQWPTEVKIGFLSFYPQIDEVAAMEFAVTKLKERQIVPESTKFR